MKEVDWYDETVICECDECGNQELVPFEDKPDFTEVSVSLKHLSWRFKKYDGEWYDFCCIKCLENFLHKKMLERSGF